MPSTNEIVESQQKPSGLSKCIEGHLFPHRLHGNLCPYCNLVVENIAGTPIPINEKLIPPKPVVGWLVCISGAEKGKEYRLVMEKNFIGKATDMHIRILSDNKIKVRDHGFVAYDPLKRKFMLVASTGVMMINNEIIVEPTQLSEGDIITLGSSQFKLVMFCKDHIHWESKNGEWHLAELDHLVYDSTESLKPTKPKKKAKKELEVPK